MPKAVYAGSFDPITNGHLWMIERAAAMFDDLIVAVGENPDKECTFPLEERLRLLREVTGPISNCAVESFENRFLVDYAISVGAAFIVRGIRNESDFTYERMMRHVNADVAGGVTSVFLMPPRESAEISSSLVKGLVGPVGWERVVQGYVPPAVFDALKRWHRGRHA